jgi:hypothetical protein
MFAFLKGAVLGLIFGLVVSTVIGHAGGTGGVLNVRHVTIGDFHFYWSWMLFVGGTGLAFGIFLLFE